MKNLHGRNIRVHSSMSTFCISLTKKIWHYKLISTYINNPGAEGEGDIRKD